MSWSRLIREARTAAGLSQAEVAARAGTSQPAVSSYERGSTVPTAETLERLLAASGRVLSSSATPGQADHVAVAARSRRLYVAIVGAIAADPERTRREALGTLARMRAADTAGHAHTALDRWEALLAGPVSDIAVALLDPEPGDEHLAASNPFARALAPGLSPDPVTDRLIPPANEALTGRDKSDGRA